MRVIGEWSIKGARGTGRLRAMRARPSCEMHKVEWSCLLCGERC